MRVAITREVSRSFTRCELTHLPREPIDVARARAQHAAYEEALRELGCRVERLPEAPELPDAVFVEDVAVVLDEVAVVARPGAASRRAEVAPVAGALARFRPLVHLQAPATLDGGDVLRAGRTLFVGESARTNAAGRDQLARLAGAHGYEVRPVAVRQCLHLKSAATLVAPGCVLVNPAWVERASFGRLRVLEVDPSEPSAANALLVGGSLVYPVAFPRTAARLRAEGLRVRAVDVSELAKAEGAVTCCSLIVED